MRGGDRTIRVLTSDFFYDAMVLPATAIFNDQQQGRVFVKVEKAPEGWVTKALSMVREKNVLWSSYAVDSFFNLYQRIKTGMAAPLDDFIKASTVPWAKNFGDEYIARNVYESGLFDGKLYIMPTKLNTTIVPYNKTMVNEVGYEKPPATWDEFRVMLRKIKERFASEDVWKHMGSNTLLFLIGLYNINNEVYEAAAIDGANGFQQWRYITLPLLKPMLTLVFVLSAEIVSATQEALVLFNGGGPEDAAMTLGIYAYMTAFRFGDLRWGYAAAMNLTLGLLAMVVAAIVFKLMRTERLQ